MMYNEKIANQTARRGGERMTIYTSQRPATAEEVYQDMCDRITNLQLKPGQKISENQMSEDYGVSRSVIRTVFTRLSQRKLIEVYPQRGTYVSKIDLDFIADLLLLRTAIEKEVLYEIFETMDESHRQELMVELKKNLEKQKEFYNSNQGRRDSVSEASMGRVTQNPIWGNEELCRDCSRYRKSESSPRSRTGK